MRSKSVVYVLCLLLAAMPCMATGGLMSQPSGDDMPRVVFRALTDETLESGGKIGSGTGENTRTAGAMYWDADAGIYRQAGAYQQRFENGWALFEQAVTNSCIHSRGKDWPSSASWNEQAVSYGATDTGFDGTDSAITIIDNNTGTQAYSFQDITVGSTDTVTASVFVKKATTPPDVYPVLQIAITGGSTAIYAICYIDHYNGVVSPGSGATVGIQDAGDFWRVWIYRENNGTGNTALRIYLFPAWATTYPSAQDLAATGSTVFDQVDVFLNTSGYVPNPIPTGATTVLKDADLARWTMSDDFKALFANSYGSEISSGTLTAGTLYTITADVGDHFYSGSATGEYFYAAGTETCDASNKVKAVTNLATGTLVFKWRPGFADNLIPGGGSFGVISTYTDVYNQFYLQNPGLPQLVSYDRTTSITYSASPFDANTEYLVAIQYGYIESNVLKYRIGICPVGTEWTSACWKDVDTFDGAFALGSYLNLFYSGFGKMWMRDLFLLEGAATDTQIDRLRR